MEQKCGSTSTFCHALLKKAILHLKVAKVRFWVPLSVYIMSLNIYIQPTDSMFYIGFGGMTMSLKEPVPPTIILVPISCSMQAHEGDTL